MRIGFFNTAKELCKEYEGCTYSFLDIEKYNGLTAYDFIHGFCETFAVLLWNKYGWPIKKAYANGHLVHAFCAKDNLLIDIRGATDNKKEFWEEFSIHLFGFAEKIDYDKIDIEDANDEWVASLLAKEHEEMEREFKAARMIEEKFDFWRLLAKQA